MVLFNQGGATMKKILEVFICLLLVSILLTGCEKGGLKHNYVNEGAGFTFEIPEEWEGQFKIREGILGTAFFYTGYEDENGGHQEFFSVDLVSKKDYEKGLQDAPPITGEFLDIKGELVYLVNMPLDNIILDQEKIEEYREISLTVDEVRERFGILDRTNPEYYFEPSTSTIEGRLITRMYYGPPNYGENPETDAKQYPFILQLDYPIDVLWEEDDANGDVLGIKEIQVVAMDKETSDLLDTYLDKRVKIRGTLFEAIFGGHHTKVLIEVGEILE